MSEPIQFEPLLTRAEVAALFGVNPRVVVRWADRGLLPCTRTLGGHRRFPESAVKHLLDQTRVERRES